MSTDEILQSALKLSLADRYRLAEALLDSAGVPDPAMEQAWAKEVSDRVAAFKQGAMPLADLEPVLAKYR